MLSLASPWDSFPTYDTSYLLGCIKQRKNHEAISIIDGHLHPLDLFGNKKRTLLHYVVECDNLVILRYLIDRGWDIEATDADGETPLTIALKTGNTDIISFLLDDQRASLNIHEYIQETTIELPKDIQVLKILLENLISGCSDKKVIAEKLIRYNCPLAIVVCIFKDAELTKFMLDGGCPVNDCLCNTGETALHFSVEYLDVDNFKLLIERGAEIDAVDNNNLTPLSRFNMSSNDSFEKLKILELLLERGASLDKPCCSKNRYFFQPAPTILSKLLAADDSRVLKLLLSHINVLKKDSSGKTPVDYLLKNKTALEISKTNAIEDSGWKLLDTSEPDGYSKMCRFLFLTPEKQSSHPKDIDNFLFFRYVTYEESEIEEKGKLVELLEMYKADSLLSKYDKGIFFDPTAKTNSDLAKLYLANLAQFESFGLPLNKSIARKIESDDTYRDSFNSCKQQIKIMQEIIVCESVTLHRLLGESQKRLNRYPRNEKFCLNWESVKTNIDSVCPNYASFLKFRIEHAIASAKMEYKTAIFIFKITGLPTVVICNIIEYLNYFDFKKLSALYDETYQ